MMEISERLKIIRKARGLTQENVAELAGISYHGYQKYEYGERVPNAFAANSQEQEIAPLSVWKARKHTYYSFVDYTVGKPVLTWYNKWIE